QWVRACRRLVELEPRLPEILKEETRVKDADERLAFADLCYKKSLYAASARLYGKAFADRPELLEDHDKYHRYNAACVAALAGCGKGKDKPPPDDSAQASLRARALDWLKADLDYWAKVVEGGRPEARGQVAQQMRHWQQDADLAALRDEA